jgi:diguanylate cyclase (GGDEF)-like protein
MTDKPKDTESHGLEDLDEPSDLTGQERDDELLSDASDFIAEDRDRISELQDMAAENRDERAEGRDRRAEAREQRARTSDLEAGADRAGARRDRRGAAGDRGQSAEDRVAAKADRRLSGRKRKATSIDELTGAVRRGAGMQQLEEDLTRVKSSGESFVLGFLDLDGLKATNDALGHAAGDRLLVRVVATMRANLRSHDLIVRFGGDEFLCGMEQVSMEEAAEIFTRIQADLSASEASVTVGLAQLTERDSLDDLVMRANAAMHTKRTRHHRKRPR